jgi:hypothetical protein
MEFSNLSYSNLTYSDPALIPKKIRLLIVGVWGVGWGLGVGMGSQNPSKDGSCYVYQSPLKSKGIVETYKQKKEIKKNKSNK